MAILVAFVVEATEFERGWGQRPDGYVCFEHEDFATTFLKEDHDKKVGTSVPDYYVNYTKVGYKECSRRNMDKIRDHGKLWINNFNELKQ